MLLISKASIRFPYFEKKKKLTKKHCAGLTLVIVVGARRRIVICDTFRNFSCSNGNDYIYMLVALDTYLSFKMGAQKFAYIISYLPIWFIIKFIMQAAHYICTCFKFVNNILYYREIAFNSQHERSYIRLSITIFYAYFSF